LINTNTLVAIMAIEGVVVGEVLGVVAGEVMRVAEVCTLDHPMCRDQIN
jgi:hypothetical protein